MNGIGQREFEAVLAARAESLEPGTAPVEAALAGSRRRMARRRIAAATAGVLAVAGVAVEVSTFGGAGRSGGAISAGQPAKSTASTHSSKGAPGTAHREAPTVTQQAVPVPDPKTFRNPTVFARGTVNGKPWKMVGSEGPGGPFYDPKGQLSMEHGYPWLAQLWIGDTLIVQCGGVAQTHADVGGGFCAGGTNQVSAFGFVDAHAVGALWTGPDGLRYTATPLATDFSDLKIVIFPMQVTRNPGDAVVVDPAQGGVQPLYVSHFSDGFEPVPTRPVETMPTRISPSHP